MRICHLLLTRFNIQYEFNETSGINPTWLDERLQLFEQYCLPSVMNQSCKDFIWLFFCDIRTPNKYKTIINQYKTQIPQLHIQWVPYYDNDYYELFTNIGREYAQGYDLLVTSRIDNDDSIAYNYIELVQKAAREGIMGIISFPKGKQTFAHENKSYIVKYIQNHFTSRIENTKFETILVFNHALVSPHDITTIETHEPMWEEIVHSGNMYNDYTPAYQYYVKNLSDFTDLFQRWIRYQAKHLANIMDFSFIHANKVH